MIAPVLLHDNGQAAIVCFAGATTSPQRKEVARG